MRRNKSDDSGGHWARLPSRLEGAQRSSGQRVNGCAMSISDSIRPQLVPITPEGYPFIGAFALVSLILFWLWTPLGWLGTVATLWCVYFFRDPPRVTPVREGLVVAPADGRVSQITTAAAAARTGPRRDAAAAHFDLHERVRLPRQPQPGRRPHREDRLPAGQVPQRRSRQGERRQRAQFAGHRHRRAASRWCRSPALSRGASSASCAKGQPVGAGERFGMIRFGSRLDVYLPEGATPLVAVGQTAIAGETVLADLRAGDGTRVSQRLIVNAAKEPPWRHRGAPRRQAAIFVPWSFSPSIPRRRRAAAASRRSRCARCCPI